jgi:endonuclease YncB( thermonuclease family)
MNIKASLYTLIPALALFAGEPALAQEARVIDGDTLEAGGRVFHLSGIDAPEPGQTCQWPNKEIPCGDISRTAMMDLVAGAKVVCKPVAGGTDSKEGIEAVCVAGGFDIGANMVHTGWAVVSPGGPEAYRRTEERARAAKHGLWRGEFTMPWDWRAKQGHQ